MKFKTILEELTPKQLDVLELRMGTLSGCIIQYVKKLNPKQIEVSLSKPQDKDDFRKFLEKQVFMTGYKIEEDVFFIIDLI